MMGKLNELVIEFSKPYYEPGETLQGRIKVHLNDAMELKDIRVSFYGKANVHWKTGGRYPTHYRAVEEYLNHVIRLWGTGDSQMHPPGLHYYPFQLQLPYNIPSSFLGDRRYMGLLHGGTVEIGYVSYTCKVTLGIPIFPDHVRTCDFTVFKRIDLNCFPQLMNPARQDKEGSVNCCCARGGISATIKINKQAFIPGENIIINAEIENYSSSKMTTSVYLKRYALYYGQSTSLLGSDSLVPTCAKTVVTQMVHPSFSRGRPDTWVNEALQVPPIHQTMMMECGIINVFYMLEMHVNVNWGSGPTLKIPVLIGSIPYSDMETGRIPDDMTADLIREFLSLAQQGETTTRSASVQPRLRPVPQEDSTSAGYKRLS